MTKQQDLTQGVIWRGLLGFFFPILLGAFFQQLYNAVDTVVVGNFVGKQALAAVGGSAAQVVSLLVGFFMGLSNGGTVVLAHAFGARDAEAMRRSLHTALAFALAGGVVLTAVGLALSGPTLRWMRTPEDTMTYSLQYLRIIFGGSLACMVYNMGSGLLRALGDSRRPVLYLAVCCVTNIILDLFFVLVLQLEVVGVAAATVLSQVLSAALIVRALCRLGPDCCLRLRALRIDRPQLRRILAIGLPSAVQASTYSISNLLIQVPVNALGTDTVAAWTATSKVDSIYWMVMNAFGMTVLTFVSQNYGAGDMPRTRRGIRTCLLGGLCVGLVISWSLFFFGSYVLRLFTRDAEVVRIGVIMIRMLTPLYASYVFVELFSNTLRGFGDSFLPTMIVILGVCVLRILWVFLAVPLRPCVEMICVSYPLTWVVTGVSLTIYYLRRGRKRASAALEREV